MIQRLVSIGRCFFEQKGYVLLLILMPYWWYFLYYSLRLSKPILWIDPHGAENRYSEERFVKFNRVMDEAFAHKQSITEYLTPEVYLYAKIVVFLIVIVLVYFHLKKYGSSKILLWYIRGMVVYTIVQYTKYTPRWYHWDCGNLEAWWAQGLRIFPSEEDYISITVSLFIMYYLLRGLDIWKKLRENSMIE